MINTIVVTGGGTGGHLSIAKVLIDGFKQKGYKVIFIGSTKGSDKDWFEEYSNLDKAYFLDTKGVVNQNITGKLNSLWMIFKATKKCLNIFKEHSVNKVVSVGGFSASPASFAAMISKVDFYIHEQNSVMGRLNSITSKSAKDVFGSYNNATFNIDYPVDEIYFNNQRVRTNCNTIIFLGGSQGAKSINDFALKVAPQLSKMGINIIHQAGINNYKSVQLEYEKLGINVDCFGFTKDLITKIKKADLAVCRAGAGTVWELCASGIPALYVPYPYAAANHQYFNAKFIEDKNLGVVLEQNNLSEEKLLEFINSDIEVRSQGLIDLIKPNGLSMMIERIVH